MAADPALIEQLSDILQKLGRISTRRIFSGAGLYVDGLIISIVRGDGSVFFKVDELTRPRFVEAGSSPFTYARKSGEKSLHSYWTLPVDPFDDPDEVLSYGRLALAASRRARIAEDVEAKATLAKGSVGKGKVGKAKAVTTKVGKLASSSGLDAKASIGSGKRPRKG